MGKVINLKIYSQRTLKRAAGADGARLWGCSVCANHTWTLSTSAEICCASCGAAASNLAAVETFKSVAATH